MTMFKIQVSVRLFLFYTMIWTGYGEEGKNMQNEIMLFLITLFLSVIIWFTMISSRFIGNTLLNRP